MGSILLIIGTILACYSTFKMSQQLHEWFPYGGHSKFWWIKHVPLFGLGLILLAASEGSTSGILIGAGMVAGSYLCGSFLKQKSMRS